MAELIVELAEPAMPVAAEGVEPALVAGIVDVGGEPGCALGCDQRVVVGGGVRLDEHLFRHLRLQGPAGGLTAWAPRSRSRATKTGPPARRSTRRAARFRPPRDCV